MDVVARLEAVEAENDLLREQIRQLQTLLGMSFPAPLEFGLTPSEGRAFGVLMSRDYASKDAIMAGLYADRPDAEVELKIVDVFICKARKKLKPFKVEIETVWGQGYRITPAMKETVKGMMAKDLVAIHEAVSV